MNKFEQQSQPDQETGISRREFLKKAGMGILALKAFELGLLSGNSEAKEKNTEALNDLDKLINGYIEQDTYLSEQEIRESLEKCGFIENFNIQELQIKNPWKPFTKRDVLKEALNEAISTDNLSLNEDNLNIVQTDFNKIGALFCGAFYYDEYKSIFINQENPKWKKDRIESLIYSEVISSEYKRIESSFHNSDISYIEKDQKRASLDEWFDKSMKNPKKYTEIPDLVLRHRESIIKSIRAFRTREAIKQIITQTGLPHEAFHYFYETGFVREGYEGPSVNELLAMAIRGKHQRFGDKDPGYASIGYFLKDIDINDKEKLNKFCKNIIDKYDITSNPKKYSQEEWKYLSDKEKDDCLIQESFFQFLNEYLARIYNGAVGNDPVNVKMKLEEAVIQQNGILPQYDLEDLYHDPTDEELAFLKQMKWKGTPILKIKE
ncbi:hypothetical protein K9L27_02615 [Candidatus Gracilibacteria bacterium]|nr:hypothetical protein [Candidatus Gracilibacteria bacterium]